MIKGNLKILWFKTYVPVPQFHIMVTSSIVHTVKVWLSLYFRETNLDSRKDGFHFIHTRETPVKRQPKICLV